MKISKTLERKRIEQTIKLYGLTKNFRKAGYILRDGRMINFAPFPNEDIWLKSRYHRTEDILAAKGQVYLFKKGAVRVNAGESWGKPTPIVTFEIDGGRKFTKKQLNVMRQLFTLFKKENPTRPTTLSISMNHKIYPTSKGGSFKSFNAFERWLKIQ